VKNYAVEDSASYVLRHQRILGSLKRQSLQKIAKNVRDVGTQQISIGTQLSRLWFFKLNVVKSINNEETTILSVGTPQNFRLSIRAT